MIDLFESSCNTNVIQHNGVDPGFCKRRGHNITKVLYFVTSNSKKPHHRFFSAECKKEEKEKRVIVSRGWGRNIGPVY